MTIISSNRLTKSWRKIIKLSCPLTAIVWVSNPILENSRVAWESVLIEKLPSKSEVGPWYVTEIITVAPGNGFPSASEMLPVMVCWACYKRPQNNRIVITTNLIFFLWFGFWLKPNIEKLFIFDNVDRVYEFDKLTKRFFLFNKI